MNIGIVGLGLIGGSLARSIRQSTDNKVYGYDKKDSVVLKAQVFKAIDAELTPEILPTCDMVIIALYPEDTVSFVTRNKDKFKKGCIVLDTCGVKKCVCEPLFEVAKENGFTFIGAHPMAGIEFSGFDASRNTLFEDASMIIVPTPYITIDEMREVKQLFTKIGFSHFEITDADKHDKVIAVTSQLAHVVSSAYVKSPTAPMYKGFSAGSFKDMTRVARLNEKMWTELFFDNKENLINEIDGMIERLKEYSDALKNDDRDGLCELLRQGREVKISLD